MCGLGQRLPTHRFAAKDIVRHNLHADPFGLSVQGSYKSLRKREQQSYNSDRAKCFYDLVSPTQTIKFTGHAPQRGECLNNSKTKQNSRR